MRTPRSSPASEAKSTIAKDPSRADALRRAFRERPLSTFLSTGFGSGLSPLAPGTAGSLVALAISVVAMRALNPSHGASIAGAVGLLASGLATAAIAIPLTTRASRAMGMKDPGAIVLDEFAGQFIASAAVPLFSYASSAREILAWAVSFVAFRIFDVWKPGPIRRIQDLPEGLGIVLDDVLAGFLAAGLTVLVGGALSS
jgi:phosphatidylglycerophosphatase A